MRLRFRRIGRLACLLIGVGCAHPPRPAPRVTGPTLALQLDDGRASERPLIPPKLFEALMRFEPTVPKWRLLDVRFLLAQPGRIVLTVYEDTGDRPGKAVATFDQVYPSSFVSSGKDGRWVVAPLELPPRTGSLWIGLYNPTGDARLWASSNASTVRMRDPDPASPLEKIPRTPMLRLDLALAEPE